MGLLGVLLTKSLSRVLRNMRLHSFIALPLISAMFSFSYLYSLEQPQPSTPSVIETEEVVTSEVEDVEINPTVIEEDNRETTLEEVIVQSTHPGIIYTQNEVRLIPALEAICVCESGKQFHPDGSVVRGRVNPLDIGMCQINQKYHGEASEALGFDIFTEVGNIKYSNHLYKQQGAQPWFWSKPCHGRG